MDRPPGAAPRPWAHFRVESDRAVLEPGAIYHGGVLLADGIGSATVALYDGHDSAGDLIDYFDAGVSAPDIHHHDPGIEVARRLYVDLGSNVSRFTVFYEPAPRTAGQRPES